MKCGIQNCTQGDNRFLWHCHGTCGRSFHAACIGAQRNNEEVLRTFMLPLCHDCQEQFTTELKLKVLTASLRQIDSSIGRTLESNHKLISNYSSLSASHDEAMDSIDKSLHNFNSRLEHLEIMFKKNLADVKNAVVSLCDTPPVDTTAAAESVAKSAANAAVAEITTTAAIVAANTAESIERLPQIISTLKNELCDSHSTLMNDVKAHFEEMHKSLSVSQSGKNIPAYCNCGNLAEELNKPVELYGWRIIGDKKVWKQDWSEFDAKQQVRRLQQKQQDKARRRRMQKRRRQQKNKYDNNNKIKNNNNTHKTNAMQNHPRMNASDRELLATAKLQFAGPPSTTDHPIPGLSAPKFINFMKGETINQYRATQSQMESVVPLVSNNNNSNIINTTYPNNNNNNNRLDPMRPPVVRLTEQSTTGDKRYLKARLRDHKIMDTVRTYLAFLHDQPTTVCIRGITRISASVMMAAEGLPTDTNLLREIFLDVHEELGISRNDALADLQSHRTSLSSERTHRLQQLRETTNKFYNPSFRK